MENNKLWYRVLKKAGLFEIWLNENSRQEKQNKLVDFIVDKIGKDEISDDFTKSIKEKVRLFCKSLSEMWAKYGKSFEKDKKAEKFQSEYVVWLNAEITFENKSKSGKVTCSALGRPQLTFFEKSEYGKRKAAADLSSETNNETELLVRARKNSRSNNLLDIFNRATDTSDPLISSKYLSRSMRQHKVLHFPPTAIELLSIESPIEVINADEENYENEILSPTSVDALNNICLLNEIED